MFASRLPIKQCLDSIYMNYKGNVLARYLNVKILMRTYSLGAILVAGVIGLVTSARSGELKDLPTTGGQGYGFGAMVFDSREPPGAELSENSYLHRIEAAQDSKCRQTASPELRRMVYLEFRVLIASKIALQDKEVVLEDLKKFSHFLAEADKRNQGQFFQVKSADAKKMLNPFSQFSPSETNVQQHLNRLGSDQGRKLLAEDGVRLGVLDLPASAAKIETLAAMKALQIQAQVEASQVLKDCRLSTFSGENPVYLIGEMRAISKCHLEGDIQCYSKWIAMCPTLQLSLFSDSLLSQDLLLKPLVSLAENSVLEWPCSGALNEAAKELAQKDLLKTGTMAGK